MFHNLDNPGMFRRVGAWAIAGWGASRIWGEMTTAGMLDPSAQIRRTEGFGAVE